MRHKTWSGLVALAMVAALGSPARADFNIATGLKWVPLKYTSAVSATGSQAAGAETALQPNGGMESWNTTSLDPYIGFFFIEQVGLVIGLDFGYASFHDDLPAANGTVIGQGGQAKCKPDAMSGIHPCDLSYFQFGFTLGGKFYLTKPQAQRVSPYLYVDFYKYFASVSTTDSVNSDRASAIAGLHSPLGFNIAFGAEYFFTTSFSLGAEVLGVRYSYVEGDWDAGAGYRETEKYQYVTLYTGVSLNYRFLATASVRTYEEDEEQGRPRPKRRPAPKRRPVQQEEEEGGSSPESVD